MHAAGNSSPQPHTATIAPGASPSRTIVQYVCMSLSTTLSGCSLHQFKVRSLGKGLQQPVARNDRPYLSTAGSLADGGGAGGVTRAAPSAGSAVGLGENTYDSDEGLGMASGDATKARATRAATIRAMCSGPPRNGQRFSAPGVPKPVSTTVPAQTPDARAVGSKFMTLATAPSGDSK